MNKKFKTKYSFDETKGITTVKQLAYVLGENPEVLLSLGENAKLYYRPFFEQQKEKKRLIDNPLSPLKNIQLKIDSRILRLYPLSEIIQGGVSGHDTRSNASIHLKQKVVVRIDISNYFHSTKDSWIYKCFRQRFDFSDKVATLLTQLCTYNGYIPVGSPLSATLVNIVHDPLWRKIHALCISFNHNASVWIDDLVISGDSADKLVPEIKKMINTRGLRINWKKLDIQRNHKEAQEVTGNTVNTIIGIPWKKRNIILRTAKEARTDKQLKEKLNGRLSFANFINHSQTRQMKKITEKLGNL